MARCSSAVALVFGSALTPEHADEPRSGLFSAKLGCLSDSYFGRRGSCAPINPTASELAKAVYSDMGRLPAEVREGLEVTKLYDPILGTTSAATHIATLEVDPETCTVTLDRYVVAEDCGRVIVDGQVHGAVVQSIGAALCEEVVYDEAGQILTASLTDYAVPMAGDAPAITTQHLEAESPTTVGGFRGMGEGGTIGAPTAIATHWPTR